MTFLTDPQEIYDLYNEAKKESDEWRDNYHEFERIANNELIDNLDPNLPEVNDGSLAAALFKLPKRIVNSSMAGRVKSLDRDEPWIAALGNIVWEDTIIPNANSQAPFSRKWKDAVRKAAIYGSVPLITLFVERGDYVGTDFIVGQPQDIKLEPGKVSDYDSNIIFWDLYYPKRDVQSIIDSIKEEAGSEEIDKTGVYNGWNIKELEEAVKNNGEEERDSREDSREHDEQDTKQKGIHFCAVFQRGVDAPFYIFHKDSKKVVREWTNEDPTGDIPIHFLYCYQDFVNPYGIGVVKLAGGTQNVLDYMRQSDVLATQLGLRPPVSIMGNLDNVDLNSIVYEQDALWLIGGDVKVQREEVSTQVYQQLPTRIQMYKSSLNQLMPMGDSSISAGAGDPLQSKTPAGVKFAAANLSIDDEDFKDNLDMTFEAVARSMLNIYFANMEGRDLLKLSDDQREVLIKGGLEWPMDETGQPLTNELEVIWETARSTFDFEVDADDDKNKDEQERLEGMLRVLELTGSDPTIIPELQASGKRLNKGELIGSIIGLLTDNDKIVEDVSPEDMAQQQAMEGVPTEEDPTAANIQQIMQVYGVEEPVAMAMVEAEAQGFEPEEILAGLQRQGVA